MVEISIALLTLMELSYGSCFQIGIPLLLKKKIGGKSSRNTNNKVPLNMCQILSPVKSVIPSLFIGNFPCLGYGIGVIMVVRGRQLD